MLALSFDHVFAVTIICGVNLLDTCNITSSQHSFHLPSIDFCEFLQLQHLRKLVGIFIHYLYIKRSLCTMSCPPIQGHLPSEEHKYYCSKSQTLTIWAATWKPHIWLLRTGIANAIIKNPKQIVWWVSYLGRNINCFCCWIFKTRLRFQHWCC